MYVYKTIQNNSAITNTNKGCILKLKVVENVSNLAYACH